MFGHVTLYFSKFTFIYTTNTLMVQPLVHLCSLGFVWTQATLVSDVQVHLFGHLASPGTGSARPASSRAAWANRQCPE